jgi:hypothetical protein
MGSLFSPKIPKPPQEDPKVKELRDAEQQRAEDERIKSIQEQLATETRLRRGSSFGLRSLLGNLVGGNKIKSFLGAG